MEIQIAQEKATAIAENISRVIVGKQEGITLLLTALLARGNVLLEDVPGSGKTMLAKSLAKSLGGQFARVQCTPDLLPSDITGLNVYDRRDNTFVLRRGPVFCNVLLADELNRATPRTQSGLLECMEERQVTIDGETYPLPHPFFVLATENPIETLGTFPLPQAQLDRFLMKLSVGAASAEEEMQILTRFERENPLDRLSPVVDPLTLSDMQAATRTVFLHPTVADYITRLCAATRTARGVLLGASTRGVLALADACRAHALLAGRTFVIPEDCKAVAVPVLAHRLVTERDPTGGSAGARDLINTLLNTIALPTESFER